MGNFYACNSKTQVQPESANTESNLEETDEPGMPIDIDIDRIDSMRIIFTDDERIMSYVNEEDRAKLINDISTARYDTAWNKEGIMIKMVAQDYTLVIKYKNENTDANDWLMLWKDSGRVKFQDTWYILPGDRRLPIYELIEKHRMK